MATGNNYACVFRQEIARWATHAGSNTTALTQSMARHVDWIMELFSISIDSLTRVTGGTNGYNNSIA